jgi:hypothetical protein
MRLLVSNAEPLFQPRDLAALITEQGHKMENQIEQFTDDDILTIPIEDMVDTIYDGLSLPPLKIDRSNGVSHSPRHINRHRDVFGRVQVIDAFVFEVEFPYTGASGLFRHSPASRDQDPPKARLNQGSYEGTLFISVIGEDLTDAVVKEGIEKELAKLDRYIAYQAREIGPFNSSLRDRSRALLTARKDKILKARNISVSLGYPMHRREGAPITFISPVARRRISAKLTATQCFKPEPVLAEDEYQNILSIMENMSFVMERSPSVFSRMPEEVLRDHYLVQLNGQYESATGETFNAAGKTDILVRDGTANIFIAECKIWRGAKTIAEALDQVLSYLTWRDTKAALLVFSRNKDFTKMLQSMWEAVESHGQMKRGPSTESETRRRYVFARADDASREIILTAMAFPIPAEDEC